jgi:hypothetical protein
MRVFLLFFVLTIATYGQTTYYVATNGNSSNNGLSASSPKDLASGIAAATTPGDIVYIKKGTYNRSSQLTINQSGTAANPIQFIGYNNTIGDIVSEPHSSITYGQTLAQTNMPVIARSGGTETTNATSISGNYLVFKNIAITGFNIGWGVYGDYNTLDNVAFFELGPQTGDVYRGYGVRVNGAYNVVQNSYGQNVSAEAFLTRGNYNQFLYNEYRNDNTGAQTDYYMTVRGTAAGDGVFNLFEGNRIYRMHSGSHQGHGYDVKSGNNNIFRDNYALGTKLEVNLSNTWGNLFQRNFLEGTNSRMHISNGAHDNIFDGNILINGGYQGINGFYYSEPSSAPFNCICVGDDNVFINNIIVGSTKSIQMQEDGAVGVAANIPAVRGWIFKNNLFIGQTLGGFRTNVSVVDFEFENNIWMQQGTSATQFQSLFGATGTNVTFNRENYFNNSFATPSGAMFSNITAHNPLFVNAGARNYRLQANSPLINIGATTSYPRDADNTPRPQGSGFDIGPYEWFTGDISEDTTPPSLVSQTVENVDFTSFRVSWTLNEGSKGRIYFDTNTGTNIGDYPNFTNIENSFLTFHRQTVGGSNPFPLTAGTTYYYRYYLEDVNGNIALSPEYTVTTLGEEAPEPEDTTAPSLVGAPTIQNITNTSFQVEWTLDEGSKGRIFFGTASGTTIEDYTAFTALENSFITFHRQTVGGSNPAPLEEGTTYYFRIYTEDSNGNSRLSAEYTATTLDDESEIPDPEVSVGKFDLRGLFLKKKKL